MGYTCAFLATLRFCISVVCYSSVVAMENKLSLSPSPICDRNYNSFTFWAKFRPGNTQNGGTVLLPIANPMADSESGNPDFYSSFLVG